MPLFWILFAALVLLTNVLNSRFVPITGTGRIYITGILPFVLVGLFSWLARAKGYRYAFLCLIPTVFVLVLLEGGFRFYYYVIADPQERVLLASPSTRRIGDSHVYKPHHYSLYTLNPDYRPEEGIRHNSLGFRDEREFPPDHKAIRIVFLGGSSTYTIHVRDNKRIFTYGLEQMLNERFKDQLGEHRIEVINAGMGGATSAENLIRLIYSISEISPALVVIQHGLNDSFPRLFGTLQSDYGNLRKCWEAPSVFDHRYTIAYSTVLWFCRFSMLGNYIAYKAKLLKTRHLTEYTNRPDVSETPEGSIEGNGARYFRRNTELMAAVAREMGARVLLVTPPFTSKLEAKYAKITSEHAEVLRTVASKKGILFYDYAAEAVKDDDHFPDGIHVSQKGSDQKRNLFFRYLVQKGVIEELLSKQKRVR